MPDLFTPQFGYAEVDGVIRAQLRAVTPHIGPLGYFACQIGPLAEFAHLSRRSARDPFDLPEWLDRSLVDDAIGPIIEATAPGSQLNAHWGYIRGKAVCDEANTANLLMKTHLAAKAAGFGNLAPLIAAAMGELLGNIRDHSEATETALVFFRSRRGEIEFVVSDRGIGALQSLRTCELYASLSDEGEALVRMIESGVSRYGPGTGHGFGFRPIFEKLANMTGHLRFRSGDYALTLDGRFGDKVSRQLAQKPFLPGFFAAVVCQRARTGN